MGEIHKLSDAKPDKKVKAKPAQDFEVIANYLHMKYSARYNSIRLVPEIYSEEKGKFIEVDDFTFNSLYIELKQQGFSVSEQKLRLVLSSNLTPSVNPLLTYFNDLPAWDGEDHISKLASTLDIGGGEELKEAEEFWHTTFKRFMVSIVATAISHKPGQLCLVLTGGQGLGKSTWLNRLCPSALGNDFLAVGGMVPKITEKQTIDLLAEKMLINLDDQLDSYNWKDFEQLKSIITSTKLTARKAYARNDTTRYRRATIVASTNNPSFLVDTHNRRYLVFEVMGINREALKEVNLKQVYAQALSLFKKGHRYWLDSEEQEKLNILNAQFRNVPVEEELVQKFLEPVEPDSADCELLTATEIKAALEMHSGIRNLYSNSLGKALRALGFTRKSVRGAGNKPMYKWVVKTLWSSIPNSGF